MMWKLWSPDDVEDEASRGGAHKLQTWPRGTFFALWRFFPIATKKKGFAQRFFMDKNDRSNIFCCILQLVTNKYCLNQVYLMGVKFSKFGHRLSNWPSLRLTFIRNLNETTNPLTKKIVLIDSTRPSDPFWGYRCGVWSIQSLFID